MAKAYVPQPGQRIAIKHSDGTGLAAKGVLSATFQSAAVNAKGANRLGIYIDVDSSTGTSETLDITIQQSFDKGTTWVGMPATANSQTGAALAQITGSGSSYEWYEVAGDPEFTRFRAVFTFGGTSPTFDFGDSFWITDFVAKG